MKLYIGCCNQHVLTTVFPNRGHIVHKYADLPLGPLLGQWDGNAQIFGEKLANAIVVAHRNFLQDSCLSAGQTWHQGYCVPAWLRDKQALFVYFLFSIPICKFDFPHYGSR